MTRVALRLIQIGAIAVVLAATTHNTFELDRFLIPKELALHATALLAGIAAIGAVRRVAFTRVDLLLLIYLALSAASVVLATNHWLAFRAFAVSTSSVAIFWIARAITRPAPGGQTILSVPAVPEAPPTNDGQTGLSVLQNTATQRLLSGLAIAILVAAVTSLLQAYGVRLDIFSLNRSPGGTLGNRNSVAHIAAFGLPLCLFVALHARRTSGWLFGSISVAVVSAVLVLTRSRAAWIATAAMFVVFLFTIFMSRALRGEGRTWRRLIGVVMVCAGGIAAALVIPNTLRWRSDNPYADTLQNVAAFNEGSGRGRLVQYERSLMMAVRNPLFGVGPGNWPVEYPAHAANNDPSLDPGEPGTTYNPWPSSDWIAFISERGFAAAIVLGLVFLSLALTALRHVIAAESMDDALGSATLLATVIAALTTGLFDAVLLLGPASVIVWSTLGATYHPPGAGGDTRAPYGLVFLALLVCAAGGAFRSGSQIVGMEMYTRGSVASAASIDPGNYRAQLRLARGGRRERCEHARAAYGLFPHAQAARAAVRGCK